MPQMMQTKLASGSDYLKKAQIIIWYDKNYFTRTRAFF